MDKASVLGDAIKYVKQLQERVQTLEEKRAKSTTGSSVLVKRSILFADDENSESHCDRSLPEIEVRVTGKDVLIRTQSDKHSGSVAVILSELEKLHFIVQSSSLLPFGNNNIDVTIIAQVKSLLFSTSEEYSCNKHALVNYHFRLNLNWLLNFFSLLHKSLSRTRP